MVGCVCVCVQVRTRTSLNSSCYLWLLRLRLWLRCWVRTHSTSRKPRWGEHTHFLWLFWFCPSILTVPCPSLLEDFGGFGARPPGHRVCLQRQDKFHDAVRLDVSFLPPSVPRSSCCLSSHCNWPSWSVLNQLCRYPTYMPILQRAIELWYHDPACTTPVLKLMAELVHNRYTLPVMMSGLGLWSYYHEPIGSTRLFPVLNWCQ